MEQIDHYYNENSSPTQEVEEPKERGPLVQEWDNLEVKRGSTPKVEVKETSTSSFKIDGEENIKKSQTPGSKCQCNRPLVKFDQTRLGFQCLNNMFDERVSHQVKEKIIGAIDFGSMLTKLDLSFDGWVRYQVGQGW